ncbi:glycosyltransferase family 39 protein [Hymenobacter profundi]|uniref:Glycosyltransferase family 39 protein n=1 Tax=Hymenobacter profundi TaxID=1982110 RepID=A0ABS6WZK5_9BACT|nr:glycosyltransferase family 39 protein [Hymenobacter profundi]MBW3129024.1 glycosyltransferase family 39 protein [Hymenobacter profundi]
MAISTTFSPTTSTYFSRQRSTHRVLSWQVVFWLLLGCGVALRLFHFFDNRSLWIDEVYVANSLIRMDFGRLAQPELEYEQKAPILFLWLCRLSVLLFGKQEMALRLVPLLCSLGALALFVPVSRRVLSPLGAAVAMGMLALAPPLVYHSVEIKQYSAELLATVVALYLYLRFYTAQQWRPLLLWAVGGAALVWFSYASIFILMAIAGALSLWHLWHRDWPRFWRQLVPFTAWLLSFALNYLLFTGRYTESGWLVYWFETLDAFMPVAATRAAVRWPFYQLYMALDYPLGLLLDLRTLGSTLPRLVLRLVPLGCLAVGAFVLFRRQRQLFLVLLFAILLTVVASALRKYPVYERLIVFLAPVFILFIASGCAAIGNRVKASWQWVLPLLLLLPPLAASARQLADPGLFGGYKKSYFREAFQFINDRYQPGDVVYLNWNHVPPYRYYKLAYPLKYNAVLGHDYRPASRSIPTYIDKTADEFAAATQGHRGWLVYDELYKGTIGDYDGKPAWYYLESDTVLFQRLNRRIMTTTHRPRQASYQMRTTHANLFGLPRRRSTPHVQQN